MGLPQTGRMITLTETPARCFQAFCIVSHPNRFIKGRIKEVSLPCSHTHTQPGGSRAGGSVVEGNRRDISTVARLLCYQRVTLCFTDFIFLQTLKYERMKVSLEGGLSTLGWSSSSFRSLFLINFPLVMWQRWNCCFVEKYRTSWDFTLKHTETRTHPPISAIGLDLSTKSVLT